MKEIELQRSMMPRHFELQIKDSNNLSIANLTIDTPPAVVVKINASSKQESNTLHPHKIE
tara:strand:- start:1350 stop:1529 length:180 start_codon:yes stop_codon:yes gene_type:complete